VLSAPPVGWSAHEMKRLSGCVGRLIRHVCREHIAITGGVAIQFGLTALGYSGGRISIADLDLVASRLDAVPSSVSDQFLVSHYHVPEPGFPKFMIQLIDPISHLRVDIFPDLVGSIKKAGTLTLDKQRVNVLSLQSILDHKFLTISKASPTQPVDPKHDHDARVLGAIFGREVPDAPAGSFVKDVYGGEADLACRRCEVSRNPAFALAPKNQIFDLLGWPRAAQTRLERTAEKLGRSASKPLCATTHGDMTLLSQSPTSGNGHG